MDDKCFIVSHCLEGTFALFKSKLDLRKSMKCVVYLFIFKKPEVGCCQAVSWTTSSLMGLMPQGHTLEEQPNALSAHNESINKLCTTMSLLKRRKMPWGNKFGLMKMIMDYGSCVC